MLSMLHVHQDFGGSRPLDRLNDLKSNDKSLRVAITVCTRDRPIMLGQCLQSVLKIDVPANCEPILIVVENGVEPQCQDTVAKVSETASEIWDVRFFHEPELGIPLARNRSVIEALHANADWIAFIDDDETLDQHWLVRMLAAAEEMKADVLQGPVEYLYLHQTPHWFDAKQPKPRPRGYKLRTAYTNNTLMRRRVACPAGLGLRFDNAMRFTGGSDSDYFYRATDKGAIIRWVDDAWVREQVIPKRLSMKWQWLRALRVASNASIIHRKRKGLPAACMRYLPKSLGRFSRGGAAFCLGLLVFPVVRKQGARLLFKGGRDIASGVGSMGGLVNLKPQPYKNVD